MWTDRDDPDTESFAIWFDSGPSEMTGFYVCHNCHVPWPCMDPEHNEAWSNKIWMPDTSMCSIPCWVMDHEECVVPMFCKCTCHQDRIDEESPITPPPTNR